MDEQALPPVQCNGIVGKAHAGGVQNGQETELLK
jgi:hypothetical protein